MKSQPKQYPQIGSTSGTLGGGYGDEGVDGMGYNAHGVSYQNQ